MADFSPTIDTPQGGGGRVAASPSADTTPLAVAQALGGVANIFMQQQALDAKATQQAAVTFQEKQATDALAGFQIGQIKLLDLMDRQLIPKSEGRLLLRSNTLQAIQDNPGLAGDFTKIQKDLTTTVGLGAIPSAALQAVAKQENEAFAKGWWKEGDSPEAKEEAMGKYRTFEHQLQLLDHQGKELAIENAKLSKRSATIGIDRAEINLKVEQHRQFSINALNTVSDAYYPKYRKDVEGIIAAVKAGEMDQQAGILALQGEFATIRQVAGGLGRGAGEDHLSNTLDPMKQLMDDAILVVNGKMELGIFQNSVELNQVRLQLQALKSSPEFAAYMAVGNLSRHIPINLLPNFTTTTQNMMIRMTDPNGSNSNILDSSKKSDTKAYYDTLKSMMKDVGTYKPESKTELESNTDNVLESITQFAASTRSAEDFAPTLQFLASPEYGKYSLENGIPVEKARAAKITIQKVYEDSVLPAIQKEFSRAGVTFQLKIGEKAPEGAIAAPESKTQGALPSPSVTQPSAALVEPVFLNGGVQFVPVEGLTGSQFQSAKSKAAGLNKSVIPVVNQFIRVGAHLEGRTDYQQVFEEQFNNIFSPSPEGS